MTIKLSIPPNLVQWF